MDIIELERHQYTVAALGIVTESDISSSVLDFLAELDAQYQKHADGFKSLFQQYAQHGSSGVTPKQFHEANKEEKIWEFIKGPLRIYCFKDPAEKSLVLLTNAIVKKRQKADKKDIKEAVRARDAYLFAVNQKQVTRINIKDL